MNLSQVFNQKRKEGEMVLNEFSDSLTRQVGEELVRHVSKLVTTAPAEKKDLFKQEMEAFQRLYARFKHIKKADRYVDWDKIKPPPADMVVPHNSLPKVNNTEKSTLANKLAVIKLNGGLGTSMGCNGPKSVIEVHSNLTFLDLTVHQIQHLNNVTGSNIPLILLNSFYTDEDTAKIINKYSKAVEVRTFNQSRFPRIEKDSLLPLANKYDDNKEAWYPPGHGDVYNAMKNSNLVDKLLSEGKEYIFLSNIDNLGATVDFEILNWMDKNNVDFIMEVTDKTRADVKGGTLIEFEGKAKLFEIAQCPPSKVDEFKSIKKFKIFNTNNLWISLKALKNFIDQDHMHNMDIIVNPKKALDKECIQLETASGAAIEYFQNAKGVNVPRSRFLPVKNSSDLLMVQSNLYAMENGSLIMNPKRGVNSIPLINLGEEFKKVSEYSRRFASIPDIVELDQLTVSGDVTFGSNVSLRGTVIIVANHGARIDIPSGSTLENKVISGNLRILDH